MDLMQLASRFDFSILQSKHQEMEGLDRYRPFEMEFASIFFILVLRRVCTTWLSITKFMF